MLSPSLRPIDQLTAEWNSIGRGKQSKLALDRLTAMEPIVRTAHASDLEQLVFHLRGAIGRPEEQWAPKVVQAMLRSQAADPLIPRAILQALLPGLVTVARRLSWGSGGDWADSRGFFSDLITTTWEVITDWAGQDRPYALLDILSATRCRMRRQILSRRGMREVAAGEDLDRHFGSRAAPEMSDLELLARTLDDLSGTELEPAGAAVLYGNKVLGLTMTELAKITGRSRRFLSEQRRRAEERVFA